MQAQGLLAWHPPAFATSKAQYKALLKFVLPLENLTPSLLCGEGGGGADQANDADCPHSLLQQACKQQ